MICLDCGNMDIRFDENEIFLYILQYKLVCISLMYFSSQNIYGYILLQPIKALLNFFSPFISLNIDRSLIFLIPILYLFPLAVKSGENLIQIASLSA